MNDVNTPYRTAIFNALSAISVPVHSGWAEEAGNTYVVLDDINTNPVNDNKHKFDTSATITIDIVDHQTRGISYKKVDEIFGEIMAILLPAPFTPGFSIGAGFQAVNIQVTSDNYLKELGPTEKVVRRIVRLRSEIIQDQIFS